MKAIKLLLLLTIVFAGCNTQSKKTMNSKENGWVSLFDGKTLKGWHTYGKTTICNAWKAQDGVLFLDTEKKDGWQTQSGGDIVTDAEFENFDLQLDWKISKNGNSGIIFYVHEDSSKYEYCWNTGPEMQVLDNDGHPDGKIIKHRAGDLYDIISCNKETVKPVGEWNHVEIIAKDGKLDLYLNGTNVVSTVLWNDEWKKLIAGSKFKNYPDFGSYQKGRIALQDHGNNVWFRNIKIKRL